MVAFERAAEPAEVHFLWRPQLADPDDEIVLEAAMNGTVTRLVAHAVRHCESAAKAIGFEGVRLGCSSNGSRNERDANPPWIVNADAVRACAVTLQGLKAICRQIEIEQRRRDVQFVKPQLRLPRHAGEILKRSRFIFPRACGGAGPRIASGQSAESLSAPASHGAFQITPLRSRLAPVRLPLNLLAR